MLLRKLGYREFIGYENAMPCRGDFPIFTSNPGLIYLDSAATAQKPRQVIEEVSRFLSEDYANIHRGRYTLSERSEELYREARKEVATLLNARDDEVVFTASSTDSSNKLIQSLILAGKLRSGDKVLLGGAEHHANVVPRHMAAQRHGISLGFIALTDDYQLDSDDFAAKYDEHVKLVALGVVSNVTGTVIDLTAISQQLRNETLLVVDASQAIVHRSIDVEQLGVDALYFTGHKLGAHTGIGVLWARKELLEQLPPATGGGGMVDEVTTTGFTLQSVPDRFEAGTPNLVGAVSLLAALRYLREEVGGGSYAHYYERLAQIEQPMIVYLLELFDSLASDGVEVIGTTDTDQRVGVVSFSLPPDRSPVRLGQEMAQQDVCIRCGLQCAHPFHTAQDLSGSCRVSLWLYNEYGDVKQFGHAFQQWLSIGG